MGTYACNVNVDGENIPATLTINDATEGYSGSVSSYMGSMPLRSIKVEGEEMSFAVDMVEMYLSFGFVFEGDDLKGTLDAGSTYGNASCQKS